MIGRGLVLLVAVGLMAYLARAVLAPFVVAAALAYLICPVVDAIQARSGLPRLVVVALLYLGLLAVLGAGAWALEARLVEETRALRVAGPDLVEAAFVRLLGSERVDLFGQGVDVHVLAQWTRAELNALLGSPSDALQLVQAAVAWLAKLLLSLIALFYFLLDGRRVGPYLERFIPPARRARTRAVAGAVHGVLGRYLRGQLFLIGLMSVMNFIVLDLAFRLPYALPVAIVGGLLEAIPLVGPVVAGGIAAAIALVSSGTGATVGVVVAYLILRQLEDQFVMPIVVGRAIHLHPLVPIFAVLTGGAIAGVLGALLAVPIAAALRVTLDYLFAARDVPSMPGDGVPGDRVLHESEAPKPATPPGSTA